MKSNSFNRLYGGGGGFRVKSVPVPPICVRVPGFSCNLSTRRVSCTNPYVRPLKSESTVLLEILRTGHPRVVPISRL